MIGNLRSDEWKAEKRTFLLIRIIYQSPFISNKMAKSAQLFGDQSLALVLAKVGTPLDVAAGRVRRGTLRMWFRCYRRRRVYQVGVHSLVPLPEYLSVVVQSNAPTALLTMLAPNLLLDAPFVV
jgi:hypothetical protein